MIAFARTRQYCRTRDNTRVQSHTRGALPLRPYCPNLYTSTSQYPEFHTERTATCKRRLCVHGNVDHRNYGSDATATRNQSGVDAVSEILKRAVGRSDKEYAELPWMIIPHFASGANPSAALIYSCFCVLGRDSIMFLPSDRLIPSWISYTFITASIALIISSIAPRIIQHRTENSVSMAATSLKNVIVVGGSYVGKVISRATRLIFQKHD